MIISPLEQNRGSMTRCEKKFAPGLPLRAGSEWDVMNHPPNRSPALPGFQAISGLIVRFCGFCNRRTSQGLLQRRFTSPPMQSIARPVFPPGYRSGRGVGFSFFQSPELKEGDTNPVETGMTRAVDGGVTVAGDCGARAGGFGSGDRSGV